jgi:endonuclease/exonuclease/phosphatase family metal-dependent hydrolase
MRISVNVVCLILGSLLILEGAPAETVRVANYNLLHDFPKHHKILERLELVAKEVQSQKIDILILQEASDVRHLFNGSTAKILADKLGFHHYYAPASGKSTYWLSGFRTGQAILSRYPIRDKMNQMYKAQAKKIISEARNVVKATIILPKSEIDVYSVHLSGEPRINFAQTKETLEFAQKVSANRTVIISGDFNREPGELFIFRPWLTSHGFNEVAEFQPSSLPTCCVCIEPGYSNSSDPCPPPKDQLNQKVDYIFFRSSGVDQLKPKEVSQFMAEPLEIEGYGPIYGSDHIGILTEFSL